MITIPVRSKLLRKIAQNVLAVLCSFLLLQMDLPLAAQTQQKPDSPVPKEASANIPPEQQQAAVKISPDQLDSLVAPIALYPDPMLAQVLAASTYPLELVQLQKNSITIDPKKPDRAVLVVGDNNWPMPIPIVRRNGKWLFDTKAGRQEMLYRRIGTNELDAIQICRGYVDAQEEYALEKHDDSEVNQYAQRVISTPGKHDGLVWRNPDGSLGGPISERIADALQQGYTDKAKPYHGYFFKILKGQGPAAPLGKMNFVVEGAMIGGFALAAAPADYRVTGVKTFIVSYEGVVYQKDLDPETLKIFQEMELYNPDNSWQRTNDNWPPEVSDVSASPAQE